ncbi:LETM1 domain-containing protein ylh47 [Entomophthora muscae]|uniref:LETM1 domain-containing protein ylh47 n=1 Tax=Entomophthora muscae TaxID=34485 RepID=A0ACC2UIA6_9FUNG|nr:LETM1 domain-containing protein ylh47 [Entomophthora muscae]
MSFLKAISISTFKDSARSSIAKKCPTSGKASNSTQLFYSTFNNPTSSKNLSTFRLPVFRNGSSSILGTQSYLVPQISSNYLLSAIRSYSIAPKPEPSQDNSSDDKTPVKKETTSAIVKKKSIWVRVKEEALHYYHGFKLLALETKNFIQAPIPTPKRLRSFSP